MPSAAIHAADVGRAGLQQRPHGGPQVAGGQHGVRVDPGDDVVPGRLHGRVHRRGDLPGRVGDHGDPAVGGRQFAGDRLGPVLRGTDGEDQLEPAGVLLAEDGGDRLGQVPSSFRTGMTTETAGSVAGSPAE